MNLDTDDKEWLLTNMKLTSIEGSAAAIKDHIEATHKPLDREILEAKEVASNACDKADQAGAKATGAIKWVLGIAAACVAIGAGFRMLAG